MFGSYMSWVQIPPSPLPTVGLPQFLCLSCGYGTVSSLMGCEAPVRRPMESIQNLPVNAPTMGCSVLFSPVPQVSELMLRR